MGHEKFKFQPLLRGVLSPSRIVCYSPGELSPTDGATEAHHLRGLHFPSPPLDLSSVSRNQQSLTPLDGRTRQHSVDVVSRQPHGISRKQPVVETYDERDGQRNE